MKRKQLSSYVVIGLVSMFVSLNVYAEGWELPDFAIPKLPIEAPATQPSRTPETDERVVLGTASKGPLLGAVVSVYEVDDFGFETGSPIATSTTDSDGNFTITLPSGSGTVLVMTSGGTYVDESDQSSNPRSITFAEGDGLMSVIQEGQTTAAITPYTTAVVERTRINARLGGFAGFLETNISAINSGFGLDIFETLPANPTNPDAGSSTEQMQYALLLGAAANAANRAAIAVGKAQPDFEVIKAIIKDLSDGELDGKQDGIALTVNGNVLPGSVPFEADLLRFRNNNYSSYAGVALPFFDDSDEVFGPQYPPAFFAIEQFEGPVNFGIHTLPFGKVNLNLDGTGTFIDGNGVGEFTWAGTPEQLILDFSGIGGKENFSFTFFQFNTGGQQEEIVQTNFTDRMEINFIGDESEYRLIGRLERVNLDTQVVEIENIDTVFDLTTIAVEDAVPFDPAEPFERFPAFPVKTGEDELQAMGVDEMQFSSDGTGVAKYTNKAFTWEIQPDGHMRVDFANGEYADYYILFDEGFTRDEPDGDYVAADYFDGEKLLHTGSIVLSNDADLNYDPNNDAGIWIVNTRVVLEDGSIVVEPLQYRLHPNGTGLGEFRTYDFTDGDFLPLPSLNVICWNLTSDGLLERKRTLLLDGSPGYGRLPSPEYCANLTNEQLSWMRTHELFDEDGSTYWAVIQEFRNNCYFGSSTTNCDQILRNSSFPAVYTEFIPFTANPAITEDDSADAVPGEAVEINVLANDITGDLPIDASTVEIVSNPQDVGNFSTFSPDGSVVVDPSSGVLTYTPDGTNTDDRDVYIGYRVLDTDGNISTTSLVRVFVSAGNADVVTGTYVGTYTWDCGVPDSQGSSSMTMTLSQSGGSAFVSGTVSYLGGSTQLNGTRLSNPIMGQFGFEGGTSDPNGQYLDLNWPADSPNFENNIASLEITPTGLSGTTHNGDSPAPGFAGCSNATGPAGTINLTRQ